MQTNFLFNLRDMQSNFNVQSSFNVNVVLDKFLNAVHFTIITMNVRKTAGNGHLKTNFDQRVDPTFILMFILTLTLALSLVLMLNRHPGLVPNTTNVPVHG